MFQNGIKNFLSFSVFKKSLEKCLSNHDFVVPEKVFFVLNIPLTC